MKILLDIPDDKASIILAMLEELNYVKVKRMTIYKSEILSSLKESVDQLRLIRAGKIKGISAKDLLNEL